MPSAVGLEPQQTVKMWLIDSGCGHDLITKSDAQKLKRFIRRASGAVNFRTANGLARAIDVAKLLAKEFGTEVEPYILDGTPNVLSIGMRCVRH
eukprot:593440-Lingulodinium_polyedra.AAC.1